MRTARFPISCGMFSIAVLNLQERLLRRRSDGVNVSRVVSGIRCHRSGLLSWFHNVRVLACTGRPYSGGGVYAAAPSRVRRTRSFGAILCCANNFVCARRINFPVLARPLVSCDLSATSCLPASYVYERGATFACKLGTPCAFMAADGGDHVPLCQYISAFCADLGHHVYDRPKSRGPL